MPGMLPLKDLVAVCVSLSQRAGSEIRSVQKERENGKPLDAELKDPADPRTYLTVADRRAQAIIVAGLRATFPGLRVVGEEEEEEEVSLKEEAAVVPDATTLEALGTVPDEYLFLPEEEVTVFVDPVDGTREFVEGRLLSCQTLIGVSWRGCSVAGVMGLPFHDATPLKGAEPASSARGHTIFGIAPARTIAGLGKAEPGRRTVVVAASKTCSDPVLEPVRRILSEEAADFLPVGACGNKALRLLLGEADVALFNMATSLWDTCAVEGLLACLGGGVCNLFGAPIEHTHTSKTFTNRLGVLCWSGEEHAKLLVDRVTKKLRKDPVVFRPLLTGITGATPEKEQAIDVMRDIEGHYFTPDDFSRMVFGVTGKIKSYTADEDETVRYKQSYAVRFRFQLTDPGAGPASAFYKRIVPREMPYAIMKAEKFPFKLVRDVRSCLVETTVLASPSLRRFAEVSGTSVALPFLTEAAPCLNQRVLDSKFSCLLRDLSEQEGWVQKPHLDREDLLVVLRMLARFHAFFWQGSRHAPRDPAAQTEMDALLPKLWPVASYWDLEKQPAGQVEKLQEVWGRIYRVFGEIFRASDSPLNEGPEADGELGAALAARAVEFDAATHKTERSPYRTVLHGDTKAANFFFRPGGDVGVVDFQWTGFGLGATDVAYCIAASASASAVPADGSGDEVLLSGYHLAFKQALVDYGVSCDLKAAEELYPFATFNDHYEVAFLDLCRTIVCDHWAAITPELLEQRAGKPGINAYNKSLEVGIWVFSRMKAFLGRRGAAASK